MQKPNNFEETQELGTGFTPIELGGHRLVILEVKEEKTRNGYDILVVQFDTARDDKQPNFYQDSFNSDTRDNKRYNGTINIFPTDHDGNTSRNFKTFCTAVEHSNKGFQMQWGDNFCKALKGKAVGGVFGEEEYVNNNNEVKTARKLFWFRGIENVADADIPNKRTVDQPSAGTTSDGSWMNIPEGTPENLPFD